MAGKDPQGGLDKIIKLADIQADYLFQMTFRPSFGDLLHEPINENQYKLIDAAKEVYEWLDTLGDRVILTKCPNYANVDILEFQHTRDAMMFKLKFGEPNNDTFTAMGNT